MNKKCLDEFVYSAVELIDMDDNVRTGWLIKRTNNANNVYKLYPLAYTLCPLADVWCIYPYKSSQIKSIRRLK